MISEEEQKRVLMTWKSCMQVFLSLTKYRNNKVVMKTSRIANSLLSERSMVIAGTLLLTYVIYIFNLDRYVSLMGDSAGYVDLIKSISAGYGMVSPIFSSAYSIFPLLPVSPADYCASGLLSVHQAQSFSTWHPYLIAYPMSWMVSLFGVTSLTVAALVNAINLVGGCAAAYLYLRFRNVDKTTSLLMIVALTAFQPWVGHLNGQFYFDRLVFFPGLLLMFTMVGNWFEGRNREYIAFASFLACLLISERAAIISSVVLLGYWVIEDRLRFQRKNLLWLVLGILGVCYVYLYMKFFQNSFYYAALSFDGALANLKSALIPGGTLHEKTLKWFMIITPFMALALARPRHAVLVLIAVIPNLLVSVGGAEKTGFTTHYHAVYLPVLIGMVVINFAYFFGKIEVPSGDGVTVKPQKVGKKGIVGVGVAACFAVYNLAIDIAPADRVFNINTSGMAAGYATVLPDSGSRQALNKRADFLRRFAAHVPRDASISSLEDMMPALEANGNRFVDYMPIGMGVNDYIVAEFIEATGFLSIPSFRSEADQRVIGKCIQQRLEREYSLVRAESNSGVRYALYRKHTSTK